MRDYLANDCLFYESEFSRHFMVLRGRFELMARKLVAIDPKFYSEKRSANKKPVASIQAKILLPLKSISHGVAPAAFADYFQMSDTLADLCHDKLTKGIVEGYYRLQDAIAREVQKNRKRKRHRPKY